MRQRSNSSSDQAKSLRRAASGDSPDSPEAARPNRMRTVAVTSGKGGVGKTNVVANLAVSLAEMGKRVVVLDADFGLANLDLLLGLAPRFHLGHVLLGNKTLAEIIVPGPNGIRIIPASSGLQRLSELTLEQRHHLVDSLSILDLDTDYLIIDTAAGISKNVTHFLHSAEEVVVVSAPEPTAIVDAYAVIKIVLTAQPEKGISVLINSVRHEEEAAEVYRQINTVVKQFLNREVSYLGYVERDPHVPRAIRSQVLVTHRYPSAPASQSFRRLAREVVLKAGPTRPADPLWQTLVNEWVN